MGRYPEPPLGFDCPYQRSCPHLDGVSARWALTVYREASQQRDEHWQIREQMEQEIDQALRRIGQLENENAQLKAKLRAMHQRQFKATRRKPRTARERPGAATTSPSAPPRKRGAPKGHPGWSRRPPDHIDREVPVAAPRACPHCGCDALAPCADIKEHLQEDIVLQPKTFVTNFKHRQAFCPRCDRPVVQAAPGELLNCEIGPTTRAAAIFLRYGMRLSYRKVRELFEVFFGMPFVPASALGFDRRATAKGEPMYEDLREKLSHATMAFADETHWRQDGQNAFVWYGGNQDLAVFHIATSRAGAVATELLGENFDGALVTDGYAAYNAVNAQTRQSCLAHLIRKAKEIAQEIQLLPQPQQDPDALRFCAGIVRAFRKACELGPGHSPARRSSKHAARLMTRLYRLVDTICARALHHQDAEKFRQRLLDPEREYDRLFTFLRVPGLEPTNNHAEQALRTPVIFRKICFGTRSAEGSRSHSVLPSLLVTAKRQGTNPLEFFHTLLTADAATAQAALYNDSS
jgi:hypothetical protein